MVDEPKELDSSSDSQTQDELDLATDQEAPTSSADSETEEDLLSVVQSAMEIEEPEEAESHSVEEVEEGQDGEDTEPLAASDDADLDDVSDKSPVPYERFQKVIAQKNEFKESAEQYTKITSYLDQHGINADEASTGLQIMALMKNDPAAALEALTPFVDTLRKVTGEAMPDDIRGKVDDGYMDEDTAMELSKARAEAERLRGLNERTAAGQTPQQGQQHIAHLSQTIDSWETKTRQSDPDYELKQDEIDDRVRVLVSERGRPKTQEEAIAMANEAYETVNQRFKARMGTKRAIRTASGGKLGGTPVAEPKSLLEAVQNAVAAGSS